MKKDKNDSKTEALQIRLTKLENEKFKQYCDKNGVTRSRLARKIIREIVQKQPDLISEEMSEFKLAVRQLAGISRNLNQLTRAVNTGNISTQLANKSYWRDLDHYVKRVRSELDAVIDATVNRWVRS